MKNVLQSCLTGLLLLSACGGSSPAGPNVLFIVTDTLRVDRLGCYGSEAGLTPYLDQLAAQGLCFTDASSHAPWTLPSIASMLTSLHPAEHGAGGRLGGFKMLDPDVITLPAVFRRRGWRTHAIANVAFLSGSFGVTRDFESTDLVAPTSNLEMRTAATTTQAALDWLDQRGPRPFFLFVHYFDPHAVYAPPSPFRKRFAPGEEDSFVFGTRKQMMDLRAGRLNVPASVIRRAERLYDGEVAYMDAQIGRLLDGLAARGLEENTVVLMTADHGEEFLDHGGYEHGHTLYRELIHVPLILRYPGHVKPGVCAATVAHVDLAPTLCELADIAPPEQFLGRSLLASAAEASQADPRSTPRCILAHGNMWGEPLTSWRQGDFQLIVGAGGRVELYDLGSDPLQRRDLAQEMPSKVIELRQGLERVQVALDALHRGQTLDLAPEELESLKEFGYVGGEQ
jgi:arylsulfatase A-like enzyme